jgi:DNA-binding PadR family transcriptional regulator
MVMTSKIMTMRRSPLGLLVLWQLVEAPMHVYRMQKLFEERGKGRVVNVRSRASLYQTIERLVRLGLVEARETLRTEGRPDATVYAITDTGRDVAREWLRETLRTTGDEFPEFITALSMLFGLDAEDALAQLEQRAERLAAELAGTESELANASAMNLPRLFVLDEEYRRAVLEAELGWIRGAIEDLRKGELTWSEEWLREIASAFTEDEEEAR